MQAIGGVDRKVDAPGAFLVAVDFGASEPPSDRPAQERHRDAPVLASPLY